MVYRCRRVAAARGPIHRARAAAVHRRSASSPVSLCVCVCENGLHACSIGIHAGRMRMLRFPLHVWIAWSLLSPDVVALFGVGLLRLDTSQSVSRSEVLNRLLPSLVIVYADRKTTASIRTYANTHTLSIIYPHYLYSIKSVRSSNSLLTCTQATRHVPYGYGFSTAAAPRWQACRRYTYLARAASAI